jgi:hypothetical protein
MALPQRLDFKATRIHWTGPLSVRNGSQVEHRPALFALEILVIVAACGLAQRLRGHYMACHRVSAERLGLAAIDAPD